ncbi:hypothetical protein [Escherichia coli]
MAAIIVMAVLYLEKHS